jgi:hypothetical protein
MAVIDGHENQEWTRPADRGCPPSTRRRTSRVAPNRRAVDTRLTRLKGLAKHYYDGSRV